MNRPEELISPRLFNGEEDALVDTFNVLDHGMVRLVDHMGDDAAIVQAARVSYGMGTKAPSEDHGLIRYLLRHRHTTPFEMCLSGDTRIPHFSPEGVKVKTYTIRSPTRLSWTIRGMP